MSVPLNLAFTGPTAATMVTRYSVSDTLSIASQPAMHAFSTSGSFNPRQTPASDTGISYSTVISMGFPFLYVARRAVGRRATILARCSGKMTACGCVPFTTRTALRSGTRGARRPADRGLAGPRAGLARQDRAHRRSLRTGRNRRHPGSPGIAKAERDFEGEFHRREPRWRGRHHRLGARREGRARRVHTGRLGGRRALHNTRALEDLP